jgi:hypothetical protein
VLAVVVVTSVVIAISMSFPKASMNIIQGRQRVIASNLADAQIEALKIQPYAYANTTDVSIGAFNATCDCRTADLSQPSFTAAVSQVSSTTFTTASCIHLVVSGGVGNPWTSQCSTLPDTGYKNIMVKVLWAVGNSTYSVTRESLITPS